jgi:hypothetical protein
MNVEETGMWKAAFLTYFKVTSQYSPGSSEEEHKIQSHDSHFESLFENLTSKSSLDGFPALLPYNSSYRVPLTCSDNPLKARWSLYLPSGFTFKNST